MDDARLFAGIMYRDEKDYEGAKKLLEGVLGMIEVESEEFLFDYTGYYEDEMGPSLVKRFAVFEGVFDRSRLAEVKRAAMGVESEMADDDKRRVNIDPGYITGHNLVLATTKDFPRRICLSQGIFAEVTMIFRNGKCEFFEWTYKDYKEIGCEFFLGVRETLKKG